MPLTIVPLAPVQGTLNTGSGQASVSGAMARKHSVTKALRVADDAILICRGLVAGMASRALFPGQWII